jgi:glycosyltransferase involved in cell wall biosynthesis
MRVLHVLHSLKQSYGGPVRIVLDLSARSLSLGLQSEVLGFGPPSLPDNPLEEARIHTLPISAPHTYGYVPQLRGWLRANLPRFDAVVLHGMWLYPNWAVSSECRRAGIPYGCYPHGNLEPWAVFHQGFLKKLKKIVYWRLRERKVLRAARCIYFATNRELQLAKSTFHLDGMQLLLAPYYGIDFQPARVLAPANPSLQQSAHTKVALFLGRLHPKKNAELLIRSWSQARPAETWRLLIAGSGDEHYTRYLKRLIGELGLEGKVHLLGFVAGTDKTYLLQRASWFLLPSHQENFGIAVLEAIGNGCPVAISDQVFVGEFLHAKSEIFPLDLNAWATFMRERMTDDAWRDELANLDRQHFTGRMTLQQVAQEWATTISETLGH